MGQRHLGQSRRTCTPERDILDRLFRRAPWVLAAFAVGAVGLGLQTRHLEVRFDPRALVGLDDADGHTTSAFESAGESLFVTFEAPDVLADAPLAYMHRVARQLQSRKQTVSRVDGLTTTPLPASGPSGRQPTLEDLEADPDRYGTDPVVEDALITLAASAPARFPLGLQSVAERTGGNFEVRPLAGEGGLGGREARTVRRVVRGSRLLEGRLVSADHDFALVEAKLRSDASLHRVRGLVTHLEQWLDAHPPPGKTDVKLAGLPHVRASMERTLRAEQGWLIALAGVGSALVLALGFRWWAAVVLPLAAVGTTLAFVMGGLALTGQPLDLLGHVVPPLLITIGIGDAVHLLGRYRQQRRSGMPPEDAARTTLRAMARACLVTSLSTAVGFASLAWASTPSMQRFGLIAAAGVMMAYVVVVLVVPLALAHIERVPALQWRALRSGLERRLAGWGAAAARRRGVVLGVAGVVAIGAASLSGNIRMGGSLLGALSPSSQPAQSAALLERELGGFRSFDVVLRGPPGTFTSPVGLDQLERVTEALRDQSAVLAVTGHADWLREAWMLLAGGDARPGAALEEGSRIDALMTLLTHGGHDGVHRFVAADASRARLEVRVADRPAPVINSLASEISRQIASMDGIRGAVTGTAVRVSAALERLVHELVVGFGIALAGIFVVMALLLRSLRFGLVALPANVLPLLVMLAYMSARGIRLDASTGIVFAVSLGLAVDDTVHLLVRYREHLRRNSGPAAALLRAVAGSGQAVVLTSLTLLVGFGVLGTSEFLPIRRFAELSAVSIATAFVADLAVVPALLSGLHARASTRP